MYLSLYALVLLGFGVIGCTCVKYPVILVPGDGGSRLEARYQTQQNPSDITNTKPCEKYFSSFATVWLNLRFLLPYYQECLVFYLTLKYNEMNHTTSNEPGVDIRTVGWGTTDGVDFIDPHIRISKSNYFHSLSEYLKGFGYKNGISLRATPYDFRKAANEMDEFFEKTKVLVEETYSINNKQPVVFISHSLGNLVTQYFLSTMSQSWTDKYVHSFISLAAPWGGTVKSLELYTSGFGFHIPSILLKKKKIRKIQRSMTSSAWVLPSPELWSNKDIIMETPAMSFTAHDYKPFFDSIDFPLGYTMLRDTAKLTSPTKPPSVTMHCLYSTGVKTIEKLKYNSESSFPLNPTLEYSNNGDGTVNIRSSRACREWKRSRNNSVFYKELTGVSHLNILKHKTVFMYIKNVLFAHNPEYHISLTTLRNNNNVSAGSLHLLLSCVCILILFTV